MGTVNVVLGEDTRLNLILGQQLENAVTSVVFDFSAWKTTYGTGTLALSVQRPGDDQPYAVTLTTSGTNATWSVTNLDTAYKGVGHIQLTYTVGSAIKKSVVYKFTVYESLGANGEYPSPGQTWQQNIEAEIGNLSNLPTTDKSSLVASINEIDGDITDVKQDLTDLEDDLKSQINILDVRTFPINQWDETWEVGGINGSTGNNGTSTNQIRSVGFIPVKPSTTYFFKIGNWEGTGSVFQYGSDKSYLGVSKLISNIGGSTFTTDDNAYYIRITGGTSYGTTYHNDISINYPSTYTGYYPYTLSLLEKEFDDFSAEYGSAITRNRLSDDYQNTIKRILTSSDDLNSYTTPNVLYALGDTENAPFVTSDTWIVNVLYAPWQNGNRYNSIQIAYCGASGVAKKTAYIRYYNSYNASWTAWGEIGTNTDLMGKKVVFMGDSTYAITGGTGRRIPSWVSLFSGCTTYQCAFGGTRMSDSREASDTYKYFDFPWLVDAIVSEDFSNQTNNLSGKDAYYATNLTTLQGIDFSEVDILCIEYGTNDYTANVSIGSTESNRATVGGALVYCLDKLLSAYPNLRIFVDGIRYRAWLNGTTFVDDIQTHTNGLGKTIFEYADAIKNSADIFNVKYADNLHNYGWNKYNRGLYFPENDNTHFGANGTVFASKLIVNHLESMGGY